jgi:glycosyltransferase involved in cell wall biosynthesis
MKKVLIITYYWPPAGGPGVQRVLKFAKYLPQFGWQPIILTVKNGEYPAYDESLIHEIPEGCKVYKTSSIEPSSLYKKFTGMNSDDPIPVAALTEEKKSWKKKLAHWIRLNLFIPDAKIGWIPFAVREGKKIIKQEKPDLIFSSSPPPTVHLIAKKLAKWSKLKWVADFRDPWTEISHLQNNNRSRLTEYIDSHFEKKVLDKCNKITIISHSLKIMISKKSDQGKVFVISNGFDSSDFEDIKVTPPDKFTISYIGNLSEQRIPHNLFFALNKMKQQDPEFNYEFKVVGNVCLEFVREIEKNDITASTTITKYKPHKEALKILLNSDILLLVINDIPNNLGFVTGKLFEYIACKKPIFAIGPVKGDAAKILRDTNSGVMVDYSDYNDAYRLLKNYYENYKIKVIKFKFDSNMFSREKLTNQLGKLFNKILN